MKRFKIIIAIVLLVASIILLFSYLFNVQPLHITLETGQEIVTQNPDYFTLTTVILLIVCAFVIGATSAYLFYNADNINILAVKTDDRSDDKIDDMKRLLPLLKHDERKVVSALMENNGEMLQNALVLKLGLSKVKITRMLVSLQDKQIIIKERHGLTNKIKLKK